MDDLKNEKLLIGWGCTGDRLKFFFLDKDL